MLAHLKMPGTHGFYLFCFLFPIESDYIHWLQGGKASMQMQSPYPVHQLFVAAIDGFDEDVPELSSDPLQLKDVWYDFTRDSTNAKI
jgi:hypothetical protein